MGMFVQINNITIFIFHLVNALTVLAVNFVLESVAVTARGNLHVFANLVTPQIMTGIKYHLVHALRVRQEHMGYTSLRHIQRVCIVDEILTTTKWGLLRVLNVRLECSQVLARIYAGAPLVPG
jgi:hypothetical protein